MTGESGESLGFVDDKDTEGSGELEGQVLAMIALRRVIVMSWETFHAAGVEDMDYAGLLYALGSDGQEEILDIELSSYKKSLEFGTCVQVQNQAGLNKDKSYVSGSVVEVLPFNVYMVQLNGSGMVSKSNR